MNKEVKMCVRVCECMTVCVCALTLMSFFLFGFCLLFWVGGGWRGEKEQEIKNKYKEEGAEEEDIFG